MGKEFPPSKAQRELIEDKVNREAREETREYAVIFAPFLIFVVKDAANTIYPEE